MSMELRDYPSVSDRAKALGLSAPTGLAILPENLTDATTATELRFADGTATVRTLFRNDGIDHELLIATGERPQHLVLKDADWYGPTLFIAAALATENPQLVSIALSLIANYLTDFFKGRGGRSTAKLQVVVEKGPDGTCKMLSYEGDISGIADLKKAVQAMLDE